MHLARLAGSRAPGRRACACPRGSGGDAPPATASSAGIGALSRSMPRSERMMMLCPLAIASLQRLRSSSMRALRARRRLRATLNSIGRVMLLNPCEPLTPFRWRSFSSSSLLRIGDRQLDLPAELRRRLEQVALGADRRVDRHDQLFADRIDRRVGHLREELLEVVVEQLRPVREHRERRVVAHRADRLVAVAAPSARSARLRSSMV